MSTNVDLETYYTNSSINALNINIKSKSDITIEGAVIVSEYSLTLDVGDELTVKLLQDSKTSKSYKFSNGKKYR